MKMNWIIFSSIFILLILAIIFGPNAWRLYKVANLFDKKTISYNFINMKEFFPTSTPIKASTSPYVFKRREGFTLPEFYEFEGKEEQIQAAIDYFNTDGLMILQDGEVLYENYWNENKENSRHIIWSVSKSFLSALVGIALDEGLIDDINDPIIKYLKDFKGTGYEGCLLYTSDAADE